MPRFVFRLEPLMKLRKADRDRCREELADAYRAEQILQDRRDAVLQELQEARRLCWQKSQPGQISVDDLLHTHRYELVLTAQLQHIASQREEVGTEIERRRHALVEADRELRILEKLRERHAHEFRRTEERLETRQLDEVALRRQQSARGGGQL